MNRGVVGWDIGGVNTKVARVASDGGATAARTHPYELQRDPRALVPLLENGARDIGAEAGDVHAVTMTAELSQLFRTKREGVAFVLDAVSAAFGAYATHVHTVDGRFLSVRDARAEPLTVAASNWAATARYVARRHPDALVIDVGTTTTDIIPVVGGDVLATGRTDPARLASGELVYSGALRTPVEAITAFVRLDGCDVGVSAEGFALAGDVHLWRGDLAASDYTVPTPDGRPATRDHAGERLARVVCADREMLDEDAVSEIAASVADAQLARITHGIRRVLARHPSLETAVVTGVGDFLAAAAAARCGLHVLRHADEAGGAAARAAPACAVAHLLAAHLATATT